MPERESEPGFERLFGDALWAYSGQVLEPFDAVEIAHRAASGGPRRSGSNSFFGRLVPAPVMWLLLSSLLLLALTATAFAAGWLRLPEPVVPPSPTISLPPAATDSPSPSPAPATAEPGATEPGATEPGATDSSPTDPGVTDSLPPPTPEPSASLSVEPSLEPSPSPVARPALGEWRLLADFPAGDAEFGRVTGVTAGGPGYVAVGWTGDGAGGTEAASAWTSADGQAWLPHSSDSFAGARLEHVLAHAGAMFAFGPVPTDDPDQPLVGAYNVWRSSDGSSWELLPQPPAFAEGGVLLGALSTDGGLLAYGYRDLADQTSSQPGIWLSADGTDWQLAESLPDTYDVRSMADMEGLLVALGNARGDEAPWRTLTFSSDGGRNWQDVTVAELDDPLVTLEALAALPGRAVAVGYRGRIDDVVPFALSSTDGQGWSGGPLEGLPMHQLERVVTLGDGFLALGTEVRFELNSNCAPGPCEEQIPIGGRTLVSVADSSWTADSPLAQSVVWPYAGIAVGPGGVVVTGFDADFNEGVWFAPLNSPLP